MPEVTPRRQLETVVHPLTGSSCVMAALPSRLCVAHGSSGPLALSTVRRRNASATTARPGCPSSLTLCCTLMRRGLWSRWNGQQPGRGVRCPRLSLQGCEVEGDYGTQRV
jgi:hypothetical protein